MSNHITENQPIDLYGHYWGEFSNFWTDSVPRFFTETVSTSFQATAQSINEYIQPFFNDSRIWIEGNANWLWPVAMVIVASASLITGFVIGCLFSKKPDETNNSQNPIQANNQGQNDSDNPIQEEEKTGEKAEIPQHQVNSNQDDESAASIGYPSSKKSGETNNSQNPIQANNQGQNDSDNPIQEEEKTEETDLKSRPASPTHRDAEVKPPVAKYVRNIMNESKQTYPQTLLNELGSPIENQDN